MSDRSRDILNILGIVFILGLLVKIVQTINNETKTQIISDEGAAALKDPKKRALINNAIEASKAEYLKTGIWNAPEVDI